MKARRGYPAQGMRTQDLVRLEALNCSAAAETGWCRKEGWADTVKTAAGEEIAEKAAACFVGSATSGWRLYTGEAVDDA